MDPHLVEQYRWMIEEYGVFQGHTTRLFIDKIEALCRKYNPDVILDYGCGQGDQWMDGSLQDRLRTEVVLYDPAVEEFSNLPEGTFHGVICVDVLEHVPEDQVEGVIKEVISKAERFVFFTVCPRPAKKTLPDGRNCHLTIKPLEWWKDLISRLNDKNIEIVVEQND